MDIPATSEQQDSILARLRAAHRAQLPSYAQRMDDLARLRAKFKQKLDEFAKAMSADFGRRSYHESMLTDGMTVLSEIDSMRSGLRRWMKPQARRADWIFLPARAELRYQPLGVVGVIAPWNYPVNLALMPLAGAIAAGNHVMLKPSEFTPRTSQLLSDLLADVFPSDRVATVLGGADVAAAFSALPFDHLFFTGSTATGKKVMQAAAANLTPVTLELGGKSPAIISPGYPIGLAAERIAAGKFLNAGQTCIAPDYVLVPEDSRDALVAALGDYVRDHYPNLRATEDYSSIVSEPHYRRLHELADEAQAAGADVRVLPDARAHDVEHRIFAPTLVTGADVEGKHDSLRVMHEEIFGPILPIVSYRKLEEALAYINDRPRPLALYHFDNDSERTRRVLDATIAGGVTVNDCVLHFAQSRLPFGGVGPAGMGQYHGHASFLAFSKVKPVFYQTRFSSMALFRPPYAKLADFLAKFLTR
ncbi:MAG: coniferyl aldehyde dehydrogenase [Dokdonella sp.]